ncbi:MAG: Atu1372/SO_1960 family protein, partial [Verrucomicrobiota bacterium]
MSNVEARIAELGLTLPAPPAAAGAYVPAVRSGSLLFLAGTLPIRDGKVVSQGKVGREVDLVQAAEAARLCALNALANAKAALGGLEKVERVV